MVSNKKEFKGASILKYIGVWAIFGAIFEIIGLNTNISIIIAISIALWDVFEL